MPTRRTRRILAATITALAVAAAPAAAMPAATITATKVAPQTFTFTSSPCMFGFCGYSWRYYGPGTNRLGATMGYGNPITYRFSTPGIHSVTVTVGGKCSATSSSSCPAYGSTSVDART